MVRRIFASLFVIAALGGAAVIGTGAYFTDNSAGQIGGTNGTVAVTTSGGSGADNLDFTFEGVLPGETRTANVHVQNTGSNTQDIYLAFDNSNGVWSAFNQLGMYGKFVIDGKTYDNLNNNAAYTALTPGIPGIWDGSSYMTSGACTTVHQLPINYLPHLINLGPLGPTASHDFTIAFTLNPCMTTQYGGSFGPLLFDIAAFQSGISPADPFNGGGQILPLNLAAYGAYTNQ